MKTQMPSQELPDSTAKDKQPRDWGRLLQLTGAIGTAAAAVLAGNVSPAHGQSTPQAQEGAKKVLVGARPEKMGGHETPPFSYAEAAREYSALLGNIFSGKQKAGIFGGLVYVEGPPASSHLLEPFVYRDPNLVYPSDAIDRERAASLMYPLVVPNVKTKYSPHDTLIIGADFDLTGPDGSPQSKGFDGKYHNGKTTDPYILRVISEANVQQEKGRIVGYKQKSVKMPTMHKPINNDGYITWTGVPIYQAVDTIMKLDMVPKTGANSEASYTAQYHLQPYTPNFSVH